MHHYVNRGTFGGASDRPKSRSSDGKQKGRFESSSQLLDQGTAIGERFLKAAVRLAEISIPVIAFERSMTVDCSCAAPGATESSNSHGRPGWQLLRN